MPSGSRPRRCAAGTSRCTSLWSAPGRARFLPLAEGRPRPGDCPVHLRGLRCSHLPECPGCSRVRVEGDGQQHGGGQMSGAAGDASADASSTAAATVSDRVAGAAGARGSRIRWLSHDSLSFDVIDDGPTGGPTALLLHGFPERASHWDAVSRVLHQHGVRTLALDQRGYSPGRGPVVAGTTACRAWSAMSSL